MEQAEFGTSDKGKQFENNSREAKAEQPTSERALPSLSVILESILKDCDHPSEFVELYYWSREPGLMNLYRTLARLPEPTTQALESFFSHVRDNCSVSIVQEEVGKTLQLSLQVRKKEDTPETVPS